jgi:predicted phage terminase large subunit-like protein
VIEDKASGTQLIQELKREGHPVKAYSPAYGMDKIMRLHPQTIHFENGHVFLPRTASWLNDYVAEMTGFPGTKYDDQVDSTTQFLEYIRMPGAMPMVISDEVLRHFSQPTPDRRKYRF